MSHFMVLSTTFFMLKAKIYDVISFLAQKFDKNSNKTSIYFLISTWNLLRYLLCIFSVNLVPVWLVWLLPYHALWNLSFSRSYAYFRWCPRYIAQFQTVRKSCDWAGLLILTPEGIFCWKIVACKIQQTVSGPSHFWRLLGVWIPY